MFTHSTQHTAHKQRTVNTERNETRGRDRSSNCPQTRVKRYGWLRIGLNEMGGRGQRTSKDRAKGGGMGVQGEGGGSDRIGFLTSIPLNYLYVHTVSTPGSRRLTLCKPGCWVCMCVVPFSLPTTKRATLFPGAPRNHHSKGRCEPFIKQLKDAHTVLSLISLLSLKQIP